MYKYLCMGIVSLVFAGIISCENASKPEQKASPATSKPEESTEEGIKIDMASLATTEDLVCGMSVKDGVADTATYQDKLYGFCSSSCKEDFLKEPSKYLK